MLPSCGHFNESILVHEVAHAVMSLGFDDNLAVWFSAWTNYTLRLYLEIGTCEILHSCTQNFLGMLLG
jgi:hypothetical protein